VLFRSHADEVGTTGLTGVDACNFGDGGTYLMKVQSAASTTGESQEAHCVWARKIVGRSP